MFLFPMYSGDELAIQKENVPPLPLSFDRVNQGRSPQSNNLLFKLPLELLGEILQHVESSSLASLALVNRDFRQWARSRQFASITWGYSQAPFRRGLLEHLLAEMHEREVNQGATLSPSLGACIRSITVATSLRWVISHTDVGILFSQLGEEEKSRRVAYTGEGYYKNYVPIILQILSVPTVLPHLELLVWKDKISLPRSFFDDLTRSHIQHLKFYRVCVDEELTVRTLDRLPRPWPLRTLHLEFSPPADKTGKTSIAPLLASLLRLCAPTLESLTWVNADSKDMADNLFAAAGLNSAPPFPRLRNLKLSGVDFLGSSTLDAFLQCNLQTLHIGLTSDRIYPKSFQDCGSIPDLRAFGLENYGDQPSDYLDFLRENTQLSKLSLVSPASTDFLEYQLLPLLCHLFSSLTTLHIAWKGTSIPESSLQMIGSLTSLQQIHLCAGHNTRWIQDWQIDHKAMQNYLPNLTALKKLAFSGDCYEKKAPPTARLLVEAEAYERLMPGLEWLYFEQMPIGFTNPPGTQGRRAIALALERNDYYTSLDNPVPLLRDIFGTMAE